MVQRQAWVAALLVAVAVSVIPPATLAATTVEIDAGTMQGAIRDLRGVNKPPTFNAQTGSTSYDAGALYTAFGVSQVRMHDTVVDLCSIYKAATKTNAGTTPPTTVSGCTLAGSASAPHFVWTPTSSADADLNNPANYDFTDTDAALTKAIAGGARIYLRLGESYNGPSDTTDPVAWAKIAANIYRHVIGAFKPTAGIAIEPAYVEIHNEPDGAFWRGDTATFTTLFTESAQRVRAAAAAAGKAVKLGGAGFTKSVLANAQRPGNVANGFITSIGAATLDFYSAHHYSGCDSATMPGTAAFLRSLRSLVDGQGGAGKPIHISEWNIGLGTQCGNSLYGEQRMQSFGSGALTLMQDPAQNIEAAHFYAGVTVMSMFDFTSAPGKVRVNPSAWAMWAHAKLSGATGLSAQVCPQAGSCVAGYAADSAALLALAGQTTSGQSIIVTNDGSTALDYTLRLKGLSSATVSATISNPPQGAQDIAVTGNPAGPDTQALSSLLGSVSTESREGLTVSGGQVELALSIPARSLQTIDVRSADADRLADCLFGWAESQYAAFFAPRGAQSASLGPYRYRYYGTSKAYLGVSSTDGNLYYLGPVTANALSSLGPAATWYATATCR